MLQQDSCQSSTNDQLLATEWAGLCASSFIAIRLLDTACRKKKKRMSMPEKAILHVWIQEATSELHFTDVSQLIFDKTFPTPQLHE